MNKVELSLRKYEEMRDRIEELEEIVALDNKQRDEEIKRIADGWHERVHKNLRYQIDRLEIENRTLRAKKWYQFWK